MKKLFTVLIGGLAFFSAKSQTLWHPASPPAQLAKASSKIHGFYTLDQSSLKKMLEGAKPASRNASAVIIEIPLLSGKTEKFAVYSRPVAEKTLADKYDLHSYVAVGVDDPTKYARFSLANGVFNAMIIKGAEYEFIDPQSSDHTVYSVAEKSSKSEDGRAFVCSTAETVLSKEEYNRLYAQNQNPFARDASSAARSSDQKYRTLRLALSVTGEYTKYFGGTVAGALTAMNATMTRVNGVMERELGVHLNMIDKPEIIFTDPTTDPYSDAATGAGGAWNLELQKTLTSVVGEANYDIGHLFGASGGGGNAGCIGCICISPTISNGVATTTGKGSAFTSPADGKPQGDTFDIDYVAHEMGHQLGGNHTFSYKLESAGANQEPGSASTIMGYAGITGANNDVQPHSDPYYHYYNIQQIQAVLAKSTCDVESAVQNTPPAVSALPPYTIPKSTAFVLTASATDADGDALTYTWEEADNASVAVNKTNLGTTATGPSFRSITGTANPTRYFPAFSTVMNGSVADAATWEATSSVARTTNFSVTVRDNNAAGSQNTTANEVITVGNDGPFKITSSKVYIDLPTSEIKWDVAKTNAAPYNSPNVKIDYTTDNGATWTVLSASTPNDGSENFNFTALAKGSTIKLRISSIGNVFYAVGIINVTSAPVSAPNCATPVTPANNASDVNYTSFTLNWAAPTSGEVVDSYDVYLDTNANPTTLVGSSATTSFTVQNLNPDTKYFWKVVPKNITGSATGCAVFSFTTMRLPYCNAAASNLNFEKISSVAFADINSNTTSTSGYEDLTATVGNVTAGSTYAFEASYTGKSYTSDQLLVWIDLNNDRDFNDAGELVLSVGNQAAPWKGNITIPPGTPAGSTRMRVRLVDTSSGSNITPCGNSSYGQVEDYTLNIAKSPALSTNEANASAGNKIYPNPATDVLNISNVSQNAKYEIYGLAGTLAASGAVTDGKVNVSRLPKGVYLISVQDSEKKFTAKFIKN